MAICQNIPTLDHLFDLKWTIKGKDYSSNPLVHEGLIFETYGLEYALKAETGEKLYFKNPQHQQIIRTLCSDSLVVFSSRYGVSVVNIYNGEIIYQSSEVIMEPWVSRPRIVEGDKIYTALNDTTFAALAITDGKVLWKKSVNEIYNVPMIKDNILYFGDKKYLYAVDKDTGKEKWKEELGPFASDPFIKNDMLYVYIQNEGLIAWNIQNKETNWGLKIREKTYRNYAIQMERDTIFFSDVNLYSISSSGERIWINERAKSATSFIVGLTRKHILVFKVIDDFEVLVACEKTSGHIAYEAFIDIYSSDNSDKPLANLEGISFRFGNKMYNNLLYAVDPHGNIYCFEVKE